MYFGLDRRGRGEAGPRGPWLDRWGIPFPYLPADLGEDSEFIVTSANAPSTPDSSWDISTSSTPAGTAMLENPVPQTPELSQRWPTISPRSASPISLVIDAGLLVAIRASYETCRASV